MYCLFTYFLWLYSLIYILFNLFFKKNIPGHHCVCKRNCRIRNISRKTFHADYSVVYHSRRLRTCMYRVHYKSLQFGCRVCNRLSRSSYQHRPRFPRTRIAFRKNRDYRNTRRTLICRYSCIPQRSFDIPIFRFIKRLILCKFD